MNKWDERCYTIAMAVSKWSKDPSEKVGAVLVSPDRRQVSWGFNGFPRGIEDAEVRLEDKETKNSLMMHAELNALLNCPVDTTGWTLFVTKSPCTRCALAVIQAGVVRVVCRAIQSDSDWADDQRNARDLLREACVEVFDVLEPGD